MRENRPFSHPFYFRADQVRENKRGTKIKGIKVKGKSDVHYFKLPYIGNLSHDIKNKLSKLCKEFCKENFNIKLVFNSFKIKNHFAYKDPIPNDLESFLAYKLTCASYSSSYIGETCRHLKSRIDGHIKKDNKSHIFKHLHSSTTCFDLYNSLCFKIIDKAKSKFNVKIKEFNILTGENLT